MKIVVIEDEIRIREGICKLIEKTMKEHEIIGTAENGLDGLKLINGVNPDLIITDVRMPILDGLEMLRELDMHKKGFHAIVLSAYSDFIYAQQAIKIGVSEYLVKPIKVNEFMNAVKEIENKIVEEHNINPKKLGNLENIFFSLIYGDMSIDEELKSFINKRHLFNCEKQFGELYLYLGDEYETKNEKIHKEIEELLKQKENIKYSIVKMEKDKSLVCIIYQFIDGKLIERWLQNEILHRKKDRLWSESICIGWTIIENVSEMKSSTLILKRYMDWNISLGEAVIISYPKILNVQTMVCVYPIEIENKIKIALCSHNLDKMRTYINKFEQYFEEGSLYSPKEIKDSYVRFIWCIINLSKEIGIFHSNDFEHHIILDRVMNSVSRSELKIIINDIVNCISEMSGENQVSLVVKRADSLIHEFYLTGITLDEIAAKLNITPEYLSTLFKEQIGINFTTYVKELRIKKAKELLIGTQLKLYQIAQQVGYTDSKYFSKVFKECTGQLPADYRKTNK